MAKDPAFLFYPQDFLTGALLMTYEQRGKYITLLCLQQQQGGILSEKDMFDICSTHDERILIKFKKDDNGNYYNKRLRDEMLRRNDYCNSRRINKSKDKGVKKDKKTEDTSSTHEQHMFDISASHVPHMENENTISSSTKDNKVNTNNNINNNIDVDDEKHMTDISSTHVKHMIGQPIKENAIVGEPLVKKETQDNDPKFNMEECFNRYFKVKKYEKARQELALSEYITEEELQEYGKKFNSHIISSALNLDEITGESMKTEQDYKSHFKSWFKLQRASENKNGKQSANGKPSLDEQIRNEKDPAKRKALQAQKYS